MIPIYDCSLAAICLSEISLTLLTISLISWFWGVRLQLRASIEYKWQIWYDCLELALSERYCLTFCRSWLASKSEIKVLYCMVGSMSHKKFYHGPKKSTIKELKCFEYGHQDLVPFIQHLGSMFFHMTLLYVWDTKSAVTRNALSSQSW